MNRLKKIVKDFKLEIQFETEVEKFIETVFDELHQDRYYTIKIKDSPSFESIKKKEETFKKEVVYTLLDNLFSITRVSSNLSEKSKNNDWDKLYRVAYIFRIIYEAIVRSKIDFTEDELIKFLENSFSDFLTSSSMPNTYIIKQIKYYTDKNGSSERVVSFLQKFIEKDSKLFPSLYNKKERDKLRIMATELLHSLSGNDKETEKTFPAILWSDEDTFGEKLNIEVTGFPENVQQGYYRLFAALKKTSGGSPSAKQLKELKEAIEPIGEEAYREKLLSWLDAFVYFEIKKETRHYNHNNRDYHYDVYHNISGVNADMLKVLVWSSVLVINDSLIHLLSKVAEKSYKKIPGTGPANQAIGNACFYVLAESKSLEAVSILSRLKLKLKQSSVLKLINKYISNLASEMNLSIHEMEDLSVSDYGLQDRKIIYDFDEYRLILELESFKDVSLKWQTREGKALKSAPAALKKEKKAELKNIADLQKEIQKTLSAQRDRLDRSYIYDRHYTYKNFQKYLFNHGLMSIVAKTLLWTFYKGTETQDLFFYEGKWIDVEQKELVPDETYSIRLWHPVGKKLEDILSWREFFMEKEIKQAIKQVFREVYILTDAELETRVYSNRMAAHILKQHQFNTLAKGRTWSYSLLGAYDDGRDGEIARISIPEYNLSAEFWINEIYIEDSFNDAGIWNYVGTDQIRFIRDGKPEELLYIPPIVLSEVMRDTDLFVGVASVGNDPEWSDRGAVDTQHRNYWQTYSFGNLNETAKVRKQILERLLPRLKIAKVAEIKDKFLLIKGSIRTYKIHIGSTNILMEPNDEYLCIVADRKKDPQSKIFLPFEGDAGLSLLLSKAFLLAEDDKIVDSSIVSQIKK